MKKSEVSLNAPISKVHDWPSLFEQIRLRPGMWLDEDSITALSNLKAGIELAEFFYEVPDEDYMDIHLKDDLFSITKARVLLF
jgi:hypothetical protein